MEKEAEKTRKPAEGRGAKKARKKLIILCAFCAFFTIALIIFTLLKKSAAVSEFMTTKVSRKIIMIMGRTTGAIPFSMYEAFLYAAGLSILGGVTAIIVLLCKKRWINSLRVLTSLVLAALIVGNVYFVSAGFSYNRYEEYYPSLDVGLDKAQTVAIAEYFINDYNALASDFQRDEKGTIIPPYDNKELSRRLQAEYSRLSGYDINPYTPKAKTILSSGIMSEMRIRGVFFAPFGEANVNALVPPAEMPFTMAHEMAHAKGIMREDDADNTALYITLTSDDPYIRYSAYNEYVIYYFLSAVSKWEEIEGLAVKTEYNRLNGLISPLILKEKENNNEHWSKYYRLSRLVNNINDFYLKIMGQKEGTAAYIPPPAGTTEKPVTDPSGNPVTDPVGNPVVTRVPEFNEVQKIFFQAYAERLGDLP